MTVDQKADALVELGLVRLTQFDTQLRVIGADVAARNLDVASVEFSRVKGTVYVLRCDHRTKEGTQHVCEGHQSGHVCYHARAALKFAALVADKTLTFYKTEKEVEDDHTGVNRVMVVGHEAKAVYGQVIGAGHPDRA